MAWAIARSRSVRSPRHERLDLVWVFKMRGRRLEPDPADQRSANLAAGLTVAPGGQTPWHRIGHDTGVTSDDEIAIEARHRGQTPLDGRGRQPRLAVGDPHHVLGTGPRAPLGRHEAEHVLRGHLGGLFADDPEEDAQVMGIGPHGGRPAVDLRRTPRTRRPARGRPGTRGIPSARRRL